jgi:hypothetical protein
MTKLIEVPQVLLAHGAAAPVRETDYLPNSSVATRLSEINCFDTMRLPANFAHDAATLTTTYKSSYVIVVLLGEWSKYFAMILTPEMGFKFQRDRDHMMPALGGQSLAVKPFVGE